MRDRVQFNVLRRAPRTGASAALFAVLYLPLYLLPMRSLFAACLAPA